jgi:hypothetical protein
MKEKEILKGLAKGMVSVHSLICVISDLKHDDLLIKLDTRPFFRDRQGRRFSTSVFPATKNEHITQDNKTVQMNSMSGKMASSSQLTNTMRMKPEKKTNENGQKIYQEAKSNYEPARTPSLANIANNISMKAFHRQERMKSSKMLLRLLSNAPVDHIVGAIRHNGLDLVAKHHDKKLAATASNDDITLDVEDNEVQIEALRMKLKRSGVGHVKYRSVFLFGLHKLVPFVTSMLLTLSALYFSFWVTVGIFLACDTSQNIATQFFWIIAPGIPVLLWLPVLSMAIKSSTILKAVTQLEQDNIVSTITRTQSVNEYLKIFRKCILSILAKKGGEGKERQLFRSHFYEFCGKGRKHHHDHDTAITVSFEDFKVILHNARFFLERSMMYSMFCCLDINLSGDIDFEVRELCRSLIYIL